MRLSRRRFIAGAAAALAFPAPAIARNRRASGSGFLDTKAFVFAGDSNTIRPTVPEAYPALIGPDRGYLRIINAGVDGDEAFDIRARWDRDVMRPRPGGASLMVGTNDAGAAVPMTAPQRVTQQAQYDTDIRWMVSSAQARGTRMTLINPPKSLDAPTQALLPTYVNIVNTIASDLGAQLLDLWTLTNSWSAPEIADFYADVSHFTALGQEQVENLANEVGNRLVFTVASVS